MRHLLLTFFTAFVASLHLPLQAKSLYSPIKSDETVVFFNTSGWLNESTQQWHLPIHGWIYEPELSRIRKSLIAEIFEKKYQLRVGPETESNFSTRVNLLLADNERGKRIIIDLAGMRYSLEKSAPNGHFYGELVVDKVVIETAIKNRSPAEKTSEASGASLKYSVVLAKGDTRVFRGELKLVTPAGLSIISDIDDTVKISNVTNRKALMQATFFNDFTEVTGMAKIYNDLSLQGASVHFVSSSPWQLYTPLKRFIEKAKFPWADYSLKYIRFKDSTLLNLFKSGTETKPKQISQIIDRYPKRQFILIGDSGEQDPEVYAQITALYPEQIKGILIRNISGENIDNPRFKPLVEQTKLQWQLFTDAEEIELSIK